MANCRAITLNSNPLKLSSNTLLKGEGQSGAGEDRVFTEKEEEREDRCSARQCTKGTSTLALLQKKPFIA